MQDLVDQLAKQTASLSSLAPSITVPVVQRLAADRATGMFVDQHKSEGLGFRRSYVQPPLVARW
eukprot:4261497-Amphidinium_carterae.1